jgi:hypothetical protein
MAAETHEEQWAGFNRFTFGEWLEWRGKIADLEGQLAGYQRELAEASISISRMARANEDLQAALGNTQQDRLLGMAERIAARMLNGAGRVDWPEAEVVARYAADVAIYLEKWSVPTECINEKESKS